MAVEKKVVTKELLDGLLADYRKPEDLIGENGLLKQLTKLLVERSLQAEMGEHLGHGKNKSVEYTAGNTRNGKNRKTLKGGQLCILHAGMQQFELSVVENSCRGGHRSQTHLPIGQCR